ncbi:MAG TPA: hypothetical protein VL635_14505, partial [Trinickia sp.]|nr:hypothetical protein [Trinickia sp.]
MPTTTCPKCNRYSTVPNVQNAAPYACPFCTSTTREPMLLYKCFSCMKVSIFAVARMPRACPQCRTIVRTLPRDLIPPPRVVAPFVETDWLYHVTSMTIARSIKIQGIRSAFRRTGSVAPDPNGSFALDRVNRINGTIAGRITKYLVVCLANAANGDTWRDAAVDYTPFAHAATGSNDDYMSLSTREDAALLQFGRQVHGSKFTLKPKGTIGLGRKPTTIALRNTLVGNPDHYLTKLATQAANYDFDVEAAITACHVYFLNTALERLVFEGGYTDYTKLRSPSSIVVLRVRRADVIGLEQDMADFRAVRTRSDVPAARVEILVGTAIHTEFKRLDVRSRD